MGFVVSRSFRPVLTALFGATLITGASLTARDARAIEVNWSGQFRSEFNYVNNYVMDRNATALDTTRLVGGATQGAPSGYYVPYGGDTNATFETLFLKLRPKVVVNDNVYIKSEFWFGDPVFGMFGNASPFTTDQNQWYSTQSRGSTITAQRFWLELLTDFGTIQVGRVPLNWGLGVVWSAGDGSWDRYESTGDSVRLISKFGSFTFSPGFTLYSTGNNIGGTCVWNTASGGFCNPAVGSGGVADYNFALRYENLEDDFDIGVNFVRRIGGANRDAVFTAPSSTTTQLTYNIWDIFGHKRLGPLSISGELPIVSGQMGGLNYSAVAFAGELGWKFSDSWDANVRLGHAPGQPDTQGGTTPSDYEAFYFNPNYKLGMLMFNYQFANFAGYPGTNTLNNPLASASGQRSPWDNPITNANYIAGGLSFKTQKWVFNGGVAYGQALQTAHAGDNYFNSRKRAYETAAAIKDQSPSLGIEYDVGAQFNWDEFFTFRLDTGIYFPGAFYAFSNTATDNATDMVWGLAFKVGVNF